MSNVKKNFIYNSLYQILTILLPLITTPYLSRVLGADGIGEYSYHYSIAKYFVLFAMLGLNNYGNRTIAAIRDDKEKLSKTFSSIYVMQCLTSIIVALVYLIFLVALRQSIVAWMMMLYVISSMFDINWLFFGLEKFKLTVTRNLFIKIASVVCIFVFVKDSNDVYIYSLILTASILISQLAIWPFLKREVKFVKPTCNEVLAHIKPNLILFVPVIAISLYKIMDKIMLGWMSNMAEVGYYENAEKIIDIPAVLVQSLGTVMLPKMSNLLAKHQTNEGKKYIHYSLIFSIFLSTSLGFGIMAIGPEFVPFFFGNGFQKCIMLFVILAPTTIFIAIANVIRTQYLMPMHYDKIYIKSVFIGAVINIIANLIGIPFLQSYGAAIGTLLAEFFVCVYQIMAVRDKISVIKPIVNSIPFVISGIIMCISLMVWKIEIENLLLTILIKVIVGIFIYVAVTATILCIRKYIFKKVSIFQMD